MNKRRISLYVCAIGFLFSVFVLLLLGNNQQEATEVETGAEGEQFFLISLSFPYIDNYSIELTDSGYLTTARNGGGEKVQKTVLLSDRTFSKICKKLEQLDFLSPPKTEAFDVGDVALRLSKTNQTVYFCYGYSANHRKTDKPFVSFVESIVNLSPIPIINFAGKPIRPFRISWLFILIVGLFS